MPASGAAGRCWRRRAGDAPDRGPRARNLVLHAREPDRLFEDLRVADLYAGSGALGLEALSRGAAHATFVETDARAQAAIKANAAKLGIGDRSRILGGSALALPRSEPFDLVFADPPYAAGSGSAAVKAVADADWLATGGWLSVETARGDTVEPLGYDIEVERDFGRAKLTLLRRA